MDRISIVGFGHIGSAIATVLSVKSKKIYGLDNNKELIKKFNEGDCPFEEPYLRQKLIPKIRNKKIICTSDYSVISKSNIVINTVGTPIFAKKVDLSYLENSMKKIARFVKKNTLIIIKSTVPPKTTINLYKKFFRNKNVYMCFSPERIAEGNLINEFKKLPIILGGVNDESNRVAEKFFKRYLNVKIIKTSNSTEAELVKLFDNLWIDLNISLGNEVGKICNKLDVNAMNVIKAANTLKKGSSNVNILMPSIGVGGYCLTKDPWFLHNYAKEHELDIYTPSVSRKINDGMPLYLSEIFLNKIKNLKIKKPKILILGYSFKSNSGDTRYTPVEKFISLIKKNRNLGQIHICDPLVRRENILSDFSKNLFINFNDVTSSKGKYDVVFLMNGHKIFKLNIKKIFSSIKQKGLLVDGRYYFTEKEIIKIKEKLNFLGVGW